MHFLAVRAAAPDIAKRVADEIRLLANGNVSQATARRRLKALTKVCVDELSRRRRDGEMRDVRDLVEKLHAIDPNLVKERCDEVDRRIARVCAPAEGQPRTGVR